MARVVLRRCSTPARPNWAAISSWGAPAGACARGCVTMALVSVDMGIPRFDEPFDFTLKIEGRDLAMSGVSMGNPHAVLRVPDTRNAPSNSGGPASSVIRTFLIAPNVGFMQVLERNHILLRVFERGAGETRACGTGACAAVAVGVRQGIAGRRSAGGFARRRGNGLLGRT